MDEPTTPASESTIVNRLFDFFTSDKFYRTLPQESPAPAPEPVADPRVAELESQLSQLREQLESLTKPPSPEPDPDPVPEPKPEEIPFLNKKPPAEPETAPRTSGGDELDRWLTLSARGDRSLEQYYTENKDAIDSLLRHKLQEV